MYLRNSWYVAAWDHEVQRLKLLRRVLLGEPVVLYRKTSGIRARAQLSPSSIRRASCA